MIPLEPMMITFFRQWFEQI